MEKEFLNKMKDAYHEYTNSSEQKTLNARLIENEQWYQMHQSASGGKDKRIPKTRSGFIFNAILTKHADAMDNYPDIAILPREKSDIELAETLTGLIPYILDRNDFESVYSDNWFSKLKTSSCYCVNWDSERDGYRGEISITKTDLLNLFWQEGITDIQDSEFVFYHSFMPQHEFISKYGEEAYEKAEKVTTADMYIERQRAFTNEMCLLVDAYYKVFNDDKKSILHFCKFSGDFVIYSSEDAKDGDKKLYPEGYYKHGLYPFFFDVLYPAEQSVAGFGLCDVLNEMQDYIDSLDSMIQTNNRIVGKPRYLVNDSLGVSSDELVDLDKEIISVTGTITDQAFYKIPVDTLPGQVIESRNAKIAELKECIGNRDFQQGGTSNGVTSGTALSVMQQVGDKLSRDIIKSSYRCYKKIILCIIELVRQFYTDERTFRIVGPDGDYQFKKFDNSALLGEASGAGLDENFGFGYGDKGDLGLNESYGVGTALEPEETALPYFDVKLTVQKSNPYTRELSNQTILELASSGLFNPEMFDYNVPILRALQFEGRDALIKSLGDVIDKKKNEADEQAQANAQAQAMSTTDDLVPVEDLESMLRQGAPNSADMQGQPEDMVDITNLIEGVE